MDFLYPFFISFILVCLSELGDKTQILVLSFSTKNRASKILLGVALGTFFSHGLAIIFGSKLNSLLSLTENFGFYLKIFTYFSFIIFGLIGFLPKKVEVSPSNSKHAFLSKFTNSHLSCVLIVAISIVVGEFGDKTFLASLGLGLEYPAYKFSLIVGSICGMVCSNALAIFFGKLLQSKLNQNFVAFLSNIIFIVFGVLGFVSLLF